MELFSCTCIWMLWSAVLKEEVLSEFLDQPLELEDFSNRDVCFITAHFLLLILTYCITAYFCYHSLDGKTRTWAMFCTFLTLILMADMSEMDARTGIPLEEEAGARQCIQDAIMENKTFKETMIILVQYARPAARAKTCPLNVDVVLSFECQALNVSTCISNIILAIHFLVITNEYFMIVL